MRLDRSLLPFALSVLLFAIAAAPGCGTSHTPADGGPGGGMGGGEGGGGGGGGDPQVGPDPNTCEGCIEICDEAETVCNSVCDDFPTDPSECADYCDDGESTMACGEICAAAPTFCALCPEGLEECEMCDRLTDPRVCRLACVVACPQLCTFGATLCDEGAICGELAPACRMACPCDDADAGIPDADADAGLPDGG